VIVDLDEAPDGDIGPVVPPPSAPRTSRRPVKLPQSSWRRLARPLGCVLVGDLGDRCPEAV